MLPAKYGLVWILFASKYWQNSDLVNPTPSFTVNATANQSGSDLAVAFGKINLSSYFLKISTIAAWFLLLSTPISSNLVN